MAMITLVDEITDRKGRAARGWLFFDAECGFCTRTARWLAPILARRDWALRRCRISRVGALLECRVKNCEGAAIFVKRWNEFWRSASGAGVAREIWWGRPLVWFSVLPGMMRALDAGYKRVAARRGCTQQQCEVER